MTHPGPASTETLAVAAAETADLAVGLSGWPQALVHLEGLPSPPGAAPGLADADADAARLRAQALLALQPAGGFDPAHALAVVPLRAGASRAGLIAVFGPAGAGAPPLLLERLAALARALAAQAELAQRDDRLARIAAQVPGALYQYQVFPDGRSCFPYASAGIREVYGVDPEDVREDASRVIQIGHPDDTPHVLASIAASARDLSLWDCEYRVRLADGRERWLHGRAMPERLPDGSTLWHGFITPIDERKRAELALQRNEEGFRHFFEAGLVGMTIAEPDRHWRRVNRRMAEMLGYTPKEILALTWADVTHPADLPTDEANYARMLRGEIDGYVMDKRYLCKDGSVLDCLLALRCERGPDGAPQRVFAIVEDVSDRRRAERALQRQRDLLESEVAERTRQLVAARDAAQQASRAKTEFLSSMSHELRTPLNAILGFAQLIELDRELGTRSRAHLREVLRAGRHLLRLINEVLDLAQVESGRLALSPEALSLAELARDALALSEPLAQPREVKLLAEVADGFVVRADRLRLKQVLLNLVSNAIKYNRHAGTVHLHAEPQGADVVRLVVRDTGSGIAPDRLHQLFQPFSRLGAELGAVEGTGIGLALSRRLVELMGGRIGVDSSPGEGAAFWVELPRARLADAPPPHAGPAQDTPWAAEGKLVLYVEDNPANLALVEQILARHGGVRLISANTGPQGLALARSELPALILLDIHLPVMDGYELLARLRADARTRAIPVVALTAQAMPRDARRAIEAGFDEYVAKPIDVPVFDTLLRRFLAP
jgi:hypothetical protein